MLDLKQFEVWFVTGSQHLYGQNTLEKVAAHSKQIAEALNVSPHIPVRVVFKPVLPTSESIRELCLEANSTRHCIGLIRLDAYFLSGQNVDCRSELIKETVCSFTYAVQS